MKVEFHEFNNEYVVTDGGYIVQRGFKTQEEADAWVVSQDQDIEAKVRTPEEAERKLLKLVQDSPTFEHFKDRLQSFTRFYMGDPMPEPFRNWGWAQFQQFYQENKK